MVIDTSAIIAILRGEPEADRLQQSIVAAPRRRLSAATLLECRIVTANLGIAAELDAWLAASAVVIEPFTADQCRLAEQGFLAFGKGRHPAGLNFGDCFAYALARQTNEPLLYKGDDFSRTDIGAS
jgi:ribonuclease VapC